MSELDSRLRNLDSIQPPDLWAAIEAHEPRVVTPAPRGLRHRAVVALAALALAGASIGFAVWSLSGLVHAPKPSATPSGRITIPVAGSASKVAAAGDSVWVLGARSGGKRWILSGIDPATNEVLAEVPVGILPAGLALGEGSVWVTNASGAGAVYSCNAGFECAEPRFPEENSVQRFDLRTGRLLASILVESPQDVAVGEGAVWVTIPGGEEPEGSTVVRIDPERNAEVATIRVEGGGPALVAAGEGAVWVATLGGESGPEGLISRIDPSTNEVTATIGVTAGIHDIATGAGAVWVAVPGTSEVLRIDPETNDAVDAIRVRGSQIIAVGPAALWVADGEERLWRVDVDTSEVVWQNDGLAVRDLSLGPDSLWVTSEEGVTRLYLSGQPSPPAVTESPSPPSPEAPEPFAVWPEDTPEEAAGSGRFHEPGKVVAAFAKEILGWEEARMGVAEPGHGGPTAYTVERGDGPVALVFADERVEGVWSVVNVSALKPDLGVDPPMSVDIREDTATLYVDRFEAETVEFRLGYGTGEERRTEAGPGVSEVTIDLSDVDRTRPGHFLILFRDADGRVFLAQGFPLPSGDYSVG